MFTSMISSSLNALSPPSLFATGAVTISTIAIAIAICGGVFSRAAVCCLQASLLNLRINTGVGGGSVRAVVDGVCAREDVGEGGSEGADGVGIVGTKVLDGILGATALPIPQRFLGVIRRYKEMENLLAAYLLFQYQHRLRLQEALFKARVIGMK